ncbi:Protein-lysine N-methyltransferase, partial [Lachnellula suecica]
MGMEQQLSVVGQRQLDRFCRQYLQVVLDPDYPAEEYLRQEAVQESIYTRIFDESVIKYAPPQRYQLRVLKELTRRIEQSIQDWDEEGISENLMSHLSLLLCSPLPSEASSAQEKSYVTYTLSPLIPRPSLHQEPQKSHHRQHQPGPHSHPLQQSPSSNPAAPSPQQAPPLTYSRPPHLGSLPPPIHLPPQAPHPHHTPFHPRARAGTGYLSILCSKHLRAAHVLATDGSASVLTSLEANLELNDARDIETKQLLWGTRIGEIGEVDLVLGADVTYDASAVPALVKTFGELFERYPAVSILISATVRNPATFETFLSTCAEKELE